MAPPKRRFSLWGYLWGCLWGWKCLWGCLWGVFGDVFGDVFGALVFCMACIWPSVSRPGMLHFLMLWRCPTFSLGMPLGTPCLFGDAYGDAFGDLFGASLGSLWGKDFSSRKPLTETSHLFGAKSFFLWGMSLGMPFFSLGMPLGTPLRQQSILAGAAVLPSLCPSPTRIPTKPQQAW